MNNLIVGTITPFSGSTTPDKNGELSIMIQCVAGRMPNRNVLSGTVGKRSGFEIGKTYLINVREQGTDKVFGTDYTFIRVMELESGADIIDAVNKIGPPQVFQVERPEEFKASGYERKGNAVEGLRTLRIKQGLYKPATQTSVTTHESAKAVVKGSSQDSETRSIGFDDTELSEEEYNNLTPGEKSLYDMKRKQAKKVA